MIPISIHSLPPSRIPQSQHRLVDIEMLLLHHFRSARDAAVVHFSFEESDIAAFDPDVLDSVEACVFAFEPKTRVPVRAALETCDELSVESCS